MLKINRETGDVHTETYEFLLRQTHDAFLQKYPDVKENIEEDQPDWPVERQIYRLPALEVADQTWDWVVVFNEQRYMSGIYWDSVEINEADRNDQKAWWSQAFLWLQSAHEVFAQLGDPTTRTPPPTLYEDIAFMADDQQRLLDHCKYRFPWGRAWMGYDGQQEMFGAQLEYDRWFQIGSWNQLIEECNYYIEVETTDLDKIMQWRKTQDMIRLLSKYIEYEEVRPYASYWGLAFNSGNSWIYDKVILQFSPSGIMYKITTNRSNKVEIVDKDALVETLLSLMNGI